MPLIVLAIGGNSLIRDEAHRTVPDQWVLARDTCHHIANIIAEGHQVVVTHGNGPQVGFIIRRSELARHELHPVPLDSCDADTQGAIGYMIQQSLENEFMRRRLAKMAVAVITQVEVDADSPAFKNPTKPIGVFMDEETARERAAAEGWVVREDAGRGWRRVVPSPEPRKIIELAAIYELLRAGFVVTAVGGGGIPVVRTADGELHGVEAVIDKDLAASLLARNLQADLFVISTAVDRIKLEFRTPNERSLDRLSVAEAKHYLAGGQFGEGSMAPKVRAMIAYLEGGGKRAVVTCPEQLELAVAGLAGTMMEN